MKTSSNYDLMKFLKTHNLNINSICYKNDLPNILIKGWYIVNMENRDEDSEGTHWICFYKGESINFYIDFFGVIAPLIIEKLLNKYCYNSKVIQNFKSSSCGWFCISAIYYFNNKDVNIIKFNNYIDIWSDDTEKNEKLLNLFFDNYHINSILES